MRRRNILWSLFLLVGAVSLLSRIGDSRAPAEVKAEKVSAPIEVPPVANVLPTPTPRAEKAPVKKLGTHESNSVVPPERRVAQLKKALIDEPNNAQLLAELAATLSKGLQSPQEAIPYFEQALKLDSSNGAVFYDAVGAYLDSGNTERGIAFLDDLARGNPPNAASAYAALADLKATTGDPMGATEAAQIAAEKDPRSPVVQSLLGSLYLQMDDARAQGHFGRAFEISTAQLRELKSKGMPTGPAERTHWEIGEGYFESSLREGDRETARRLLENYPDGDRKKQMEARWRETESTSIN
jgi:tetratricopeptide (TPR) repeat protein